MKIAILHNAIDNIGGAEMVSLTLARELNADIYTTNVNFKMIEAMGFSSISPRILSIGAIPKSAPYRQQRTFWKFRKLNLGNKYDFYIISGDWAMSAAVNNKPNLWYVHSPLNELWQFKDYVKKKIVVWWKKPFFELWVQFNRMLTLKYSKHVGVWVCNSRNTQQRIKKFYSKDAEIVYPPIDNKRYEYGTPKNYWLSVNRLVDHKRIEIQVGAFSVLPDEKLIIVGSYEKDVPHFEKYKKEIDRKMPSNVEMLHWSDSDKLMSLYRNCKGFITTSKDEDFGMTAVEAMASGKPVIAPNEGGYKETVTDGKTGILIDNINEDKLAAAIRALSLELKSAARAKYYLENCQARAEMFGVSLFIQKIKGLIVSS
ncbi:MAG TPA: glycosyltransferase [Candidatus Paceibacterota bacterium]|nr:glycosyltransferase [Candidatus Paceibacterota bacterium]